MKRVGIVDTNQGHIVDTALESKIQVGCNLWLQLECIILRIIDSNQDFNINDTNEGQIHHSNLVGLIIYLVINNVVINKQFHWEMENFYV